MVYTPKSQMQLAVGDPTRSIDINAIFDNIEYVLSITEVGGSGIDGGLSDIDVSPGPIPQATTIDIAGAQGILVREQERVFILATGDITIGAGTTLRFYANTGAPESYLDDGWPVEYGEDGGTLPATDGGGGGGYGDGSDGDDGQAGGLGYGNDFPNDLWRLFRHWVGGQGGGQSDASPDPVPTRGASVVIICAGKVTNNGEINASGEPSATSNTGGPGGGSIQIYALGGIDNTSGTLRADGAVGGNGDAGPGNGGGGYIGLFAPAGTDFNAGTTSVAGGNNGNGRPGAAGLVETDNSMDFVQMTKLIKALGYIR